MKTWKLADLENKNIAATLAQKLSYIIHLAYLTNKLFGLQLIQHFSDTLIHRQPNTVITLDCLILN